VVDSEEILKKFVTYFDGADQLVRDRKVHIDDEGKLNVLGSVIMKTNYTTHMSTGAPHGRIPVEFGTVSGSFNVSYCALTTLEGSPKSVGQSCFVSHNDLISLKGGPEHVGYIFEISELRKLTSLEGFPTDVAVCRYSWRKNLPLLRILQARKILLGMDQIDSRAGTPPRVSLEILRKYAGQGRAGAIDCKRELVAAGLEGNARW